MMEAEGALIERSVRSIMMKVLKPYSEIWRLKMQENKVGADSSDLRATYSGIMVYDFMIILKNFEIQAKILV